jgi:hypothetical protein
MKTIRWMLPLFGSLLLSTVASAQNTDDFYFTSQKATLLNERIVELEARLASVEATETAFGDPVQDSGCRTGKCDKGSVKTGSCWCSPTAGAIAEAELLLLRMASIDGSNTQNAFKTGSRYTVGYMNDQGRSLRVRWYEFATSDDLSVGDEVFLETFDLEYASRFVLGHNWEGEVSFGGRWLQFSEEHEGTEYDSAYGIVAGVELRNTFTDSLAAYVGGRQAYMMGYESGDENNTQGFGVSELRFGVEGKRCTRFGEMFLRTGVEAQYLKGIYQATDDSSDIALMGFAFAAGISR